MLRFWRALGPENFIKGGKIKVICIPYDGEDYGAPQEANIRISNAQLEIIDYYPHQENVTISEGESQECNVTCSDIDGDYLNMVYLLFQWDPKGNSYGRILHI